MKSKTGSESINTFSGGMNLDIDPSLSKPNQYRYAENIRISQDSDGTLGAIIPLKFDIALIGMCTFIDVFAGSP